MLVFINSRCDLQGEAVCPVWATPGVRLGFKCNRLVLLNGISFFNKGLSENNRRNSTALFLAQAKTDQQWQIHLSIADLILVEVHTNEGISGIGWGGGTAAGRPGEIVTALVEHYKQALIGEDPFAYRSKRTWTVCAVCVKR